MSSPHDILHQVQSQTTAKEQNAILARAVSVLEKQAVASQKTQWASWWLSFGSLLIAAGSLAVAVIALVN